LHGPQRFHTTSYFASVLGVATDGIAAAANCVDALFAVQILPKIR
jgi:hypothetical protein